MSSYVPTHFEDIFNDYTKGSGEFEDNYNKSFMLSDNYNSDYNLFKRSIQYRINKITFNQLTIDKIYEICSNKLKSNISKFREFEFNDDSNKFLDYLSDNLKNDVITLSIIKYRYYHYNNLKSSDKNGEKTHDNGINIDKINNTDHYSKKYDNLFRNSQKNLFFILAIRKIRPSIFLCTCVYLVINFLKDHQINVKEIQNDYLSSNLCGKIGFTYNSKIYNSTITSGKRRILEVDYVERFLKRMNPYCNSEEIIKDKDLNKFINSICKDNKQEGFNQNDNRINIYLILLYCLKNSVYGENFIVTLPSEHINEFNNLDIKEEHLYLNYFIKQKGSLIYDSFTKLGSDINNFAARDFLLSIWQNLFNSNITIKGCNDCVWGKTKASAINFFYSNVIISKITDAEFDYNNPYYFLMYRVLMYTNEKTFNKTNYKPVDMMEYYNKVLGESTDTKLSYSLSLEKCIDENVSYFEKEFILEHLFDIKHMIKMCSITEKKEINIKQFVTIASELNSLKNNLSRTDISLLILRRIFDTENSNCSGIFPNFNNKNVIEELQKYVLLINTYFDNLVKLFMQTIDKEFEIPTQDKIKLLLKSLPDKDTKEDTTQKSSRYYSKLSESYYKSNYICEINTSQNNFMPYLRHLKCKDSKCHEHQKQIGLVQHYEDGEWCERQKQIGLVQHYEDGEWCERQKQEFPGGTLYT